MTIIFYEVHQSSFVDGEPVVTELASVDVTELSEQDRADTLADLKALYGEECVYRKHNCNHDEHKSCTVEAL